MFNKYYVANVIGSDGQKEVLTMVKVPFWWSPMKAMAFMNKGLPKAKQAIDFRRIK